MNRKVEKRVIDRRIVFLALDHNDYFGPVYIRCASIDDDTYTNPSYDSACGCCFLGFAHTQAYHNECLERT